MEPGGSHGLQNRSRPDHVGLGGFDPHGLPPTCRHVSHSRTARCLAATGALVLVPFVPSSSAAAQRPDTVARPIPAPAIRASTDSGTPPLSPRRAFLCSFLLPGYAQSVLGRHKAGATFMLVKAISLVMIRESVADVREARGLEGSRARGRLHRDFVCRPVWQPQRHQDAAPVRRCVRSRSPGPCGGLGCAAGCQSSVRRRRRVRIRQSVGSSHEARAAPAARRRCGFGVDEMVSGNAAPGCSTPASVA